MTLVAVLQNVAVLTVGQGLLFRMLRAVKYQRAPRRLPATRQDDAMALALAVGLTCVAALDFKLALMSAVLGSFLFAALWLDAALYHVFTFELGAGGIGGVVLSNLIAEVLKMRMARRFFAEHRGFTLLPIAALLLHLLLILETSSIGSILRGITLVVLACYFIYSFIADVPRPVGTALSNIALQRSLLHDFVLPRRPHIPDGFAPRPEHVALLSAPAALRPALIRQRTLPGRSVVLLTFESLGSAQLGHAHTPFLNAVAAASTTVRSRQHFCLAPLTNAAHIALYFSDYVAKKGQVSQALSALRQAGYATIYLTATTVEHYGLGGLLKQAGFRHVLDGTSLLPHPLDAKDAAVSDQALLLSGLRRVRSIVETSSGPFFLHIHATNAHIPYRVVDEKRYCRHDNADDRGRYLNALEETDWIFGALWQTLRTLSKSAQKEDPPLLLLSSDHGQSFGEKGYVSHGSAITREQLNVPLCFHHPHLLPRELDFSTHFDVLPTVLELLELSPAYANHGVSLLGEGHHPAHLLWDGQPSRSTSHCLGLVTGDRKYALDLIRDTCQVSDLDDGNARELVGAERTYFEALIGLVARARSIG